jgi:Ca-activated chloride channel family protein
MQFAKPEYLYLLVAVPLLALAWLLAERRRRRDLARLGDAPLLTLLTGSLDPRRRRAKGILSLVGLTLLILAAARPQMGSRLELVEQRGLDVMVALDISSSMLARDMAPNRLEKAKLEVNDLLERLPAANVGLVVFAGGSFVQFPLTTDLGAARTLLEAARPEMISLPGTAIGEAIRKAAGAFDQKTLKYKVLLLLTDGEDHDSDPAGAAREAAESGVVIYTIGFGKPEGEPIPVLDAKGNVIDYKKDKAGQTVLSRLDEATLQEIARVGNGAYFRATQSGREIEQIAGLIQSMEQREAEGQFLVQRVERFQIPLALGLAALAGEFLLNERRRRAGGQNHGKATL